MHIKSILIEFETDNNSHAKPDNILHTKYARFENGMWSYEGPCYSKFLDAMHKIWQLLREAK